MTETNPFAGIKLDIWYKVLIPFGGIIVLISFFYSPSFLTQKELFVLGFGLFLIGLGEWKNQKYRVQFVDQTLFNPFMKITTPIRKVDPAGALLDVVGIIAILTFIGSFLHLITWLD